MLPSLPSSQHIVRQLCGHEYNPSKFHMLVCLFVQFVQVFTAYVLRNITRLQECQSLLDGHYSSVHRSC